jgi:hypothetical protein
MTFVRDPGDWLLKLSPEEWIRAAMAEIRQAEAAYGARNVRGAIAGCKRAAGMALNAALILEPNPAWGRTYVEHVAALARDEAAPDPVRKACNTLLEAQPPGSGVVPLRTPSMEQSLLEAARDVVAHAYYLVVRHEQG